MTQWSALSHPWAAASFSKRNQPVPPFSPHPSFQKLCSPALSPRSPRAFRAFPFFTSAESNFSKPKKRSFNSSTRQPAKWVRLNTGSFQKMFVNDEAQATKHIPRLNACENQMPLVTAQDRQTSKDAPSEQQQGRGAAGAVPGRTAASQTRWGPARIRLSRRGTARRRTAGANGPGAAGTCEQQRRAAVFAEPPLAPTARTTRTGEGRDRKKHPAPGVSTSLEKQTADAAGMLRLGMLRLGRKRQSGPFPPAAAPLGQLRSPFLAPRSPARLQPRPQPRPRLPLLSRAAAEAALLPARPSPVPAAPRPLPGGAADAPAPGRGGLCWGRGWGCARAPVRRCAQLEMGQAPRLTGLRGRKAPGIVQTRIDTRLLPSRGCRTAYIPETGRGWSLKEKKNKIPY